MSTLTRRLAIYLFSHSHSGSLPVYSLALTQARCLSIFTPSGSLPVYSLTIRLTAYLFSCAHSGLLPIYSHSHSGSLPIYSHSHSGSLPIYSHSHSGSLSVYPHTIRLTFYLFSHSCYCLSVFTPNAVKAFLLFSSLMYSCALSGSLPINSHSSHLSSPTPRYLVSTIRFATYLALSVLPCRQRA